ncbi:unnamed protein product [Phytophthora fragariaefolia]|uniref:Unnamed protein product n=1 Tax=Phytophthora fragariaefolia TaxID=1490495 RepID=A0A9W6XVJ8_9STRA|nr:unnamed protein product [Phytophthora fragariaefolia]
MMRTVVTAMEYELQGLQSKWTKQIPDARELAIAQRCALEKYTANQSNSVQRKLQELLQQQQILLASLQTAILRNSLHSSGRDIFKELHFDTRLGYDEEEREKMLIAHSNRSLTTIPSIVEKFSQMAIDKELAKQKKADRTGRSLMPLSQIDVTGCEDHTLVSSVFVSEIPHSSFEDVHAATMACFETIPSWMKHHFGIEATLKRLNSVEASPAYLQLNFDGAGLPATVNQVVCSNLTPCRGTIYMDVIKEDALYPVSTANSMQYGISALTTTPVCEPNTGDTIAVTLRWIAVYRYKLLPDDPALQDDLEIIRPILNGDLITSVICSFLQENCSQTSQK